VADNKEKTLALLANRICEKCAKKADNPNVVKHGCCIHFIETVYHEFHNEAMMSGSTITKMGGGLPINYDTHQP
jgi:hypothetical protein